LHSGISHTKMLPVSARAKNSNAPRGSCRKKGIGESSQRPMGSGCKHDRLSCRPVRSVRKFKLVRKERMLRRKAPHTIPACNSLVSTILAMRTTTTRPEALLGTS
jgi:hypothetical protein